MNEFLLSRGLCNDGLKLSILDIQITWFNNSLQNSVQYENLQLIFCFTHYVRFVRWVMAGDLRHTDGETVSECSILATLRTPAPATHPHHCTPVLHSTAHSTAPGHRTSNHQASKMLLLNSSRNTPQQSILTVVKLWSSWICFC